MNNPLLAVKRNIISFLLVSISISFSCFTVSAQVEAGFTVSDTVGCGSFTFQCTNTGSQVGDYSYEWHINTIPSATTSTIENPIFTIHQGGTYQVTQTVTNNASSETDIAQRTIEVIQTPPADLTIDSTNACVNGDILFTTAFSSRDSVLWDFGDGTQSRNPGNYMYYSYDNHGVYSVEYITYSHDLICSDTSQSILIRIDGPIADFTINPVEACKGETITFDMIVSSDVDSHSWEWDDGGISTADPALHVFDTMGYISAKLLVSGATGNCMIQDTFYIHEVIADFSISGGSCDQEPVVFLNNSEGNDANIWDFGDGIPVFTQHANHTFDGTGEYLVQLIIENTEECADSIIKTIIVNSLPDITIGEDITICPNIGGTISVAGSGDNLTVRWRPSYGLDNATSFNPLATPEVDTIYTATITDPLTLCSNSAEVSVFLQDVFEDGFISVTVSDDSVIVGDTIFFTFEDELGRDLSFNWIPEDYLSCVNCPTPFAIPVKPTSYQLEVSDENECAVSEIFDFSIWVREEYKIGVAKAFTPNGDQINDILYVNGWGIQELIEFRIFSRGGNEVFYSKDINDGWDGTSNGKPQSAGSYHYYITVLMWNNDITTINGSFTLLR